MKIIQLDSKNNKKKEGSIKTMKQTVKQILLNMLLMMLMLIVFNVDAKAVAPPATPTGLIQTDSFEDSIGLKWNEVPGENIQYEIYISTNGINWTLYQEKAYNSVSIEGLNSGSTYYVKILAFETEYDYDLGEIKTYGKHSAVLECVTNPNQKPAYINKIASTTNSITLNWGVVQGANKYIIEYSPISDFNNVKTVISDKNTIKLVGLEKNGSYDIKVTGIRVTSNNVFSAQALYSNSETLYNVCVTPSKVTGVHCNYYYDALGSLSVAYDRIDSAAGYSIELWSAYGKKSKRLKTVSDTGFGKIIKHKSLKKLNMVKFRVRAYTTNSNGKKVYGKWSDWGYACKQPEVKKIQYVSNGTQLTWEKVNGAKRYVVFASSDNIKYKKVGTTTKKHTYID